jgi:hypothetical protein
MKPYLIVLFVCCLTSHAFCEEDRDSKEVKRIIQKALTAHGGEDKLKRLTSFIEATESTTASGLVFNEKRYVQLPDRCRVETDFGQNSRLKPCVIVQTADHRWRKLADRPTKDLGTPSKAQMAFIRFTGPRALLQLVDPQSTVTLIGDAKVGDKNVIGVSVKSRFNEKFFFDSQTGLLVMRETTTRQTIYSDYEKVNGIPVARKITQKKDGKVQRTTKVTEFKVVSKHDPALFKQPK